MRSRNTKEKILIEGRALLQKHGFNGFSFQDIAEKLKIKTPSLYDHYPSKKDLMIAIIQEYSLQFDEWTIKVAPLEPLDRIGKIFDVFHYFASDQNKVCPILSLAADFKELPKDIQKSMQDFVQKWLDWLTLQITDGQQKRLIREDMTAKDMAEFVYSQGMGSQFQARIRGQPVLTLASKSAIIHLLKK